MSRGVPAGLPGASRSGRRPLDSRRRPPNGTWGRNLSLQCPMGDDRAGVPGYGNQPINYLYRQSLSVAALVIIEQFHLSNVAYSRIIFAFMLAYTVTNGISGPMIDRLGAKLGYAVCIAWWSIAAMLHSLARGAFSFGAYRFLLGMGEAGNWPAAVKVVAEWFPAKERALASGIFNCGSAIGAVVAPPVVAWIILKSGWESTFLIVGAAGLVWLLLYHTSANARTAAATEPAPCGACCATGGSASSLHPKSSATLSGTSIFSGFRST